MDHPVRKNLPHERPHWLADGQIYFVTLCAVPRGKNHLANDEMAKRLIESFDWRHQQERWYGHIFLIMPDHVHFLVSERMGASLLAELRSWKRYTSSLGINWQKDFFEHRLRQDESYAQKYAYILNNPVRANLVSHEDDWPYRWFLDL